MYFDTHCHLNSEQLYENRDELTQFLADKANVMVNSGTMYGQKAGQGYIRINLACPRQRLREALNRIGRLLAEYMIDDIEGCPM